MAAPAIPDGRAEAIASGPDATERQADLEQQKIRKLLDSPNLRKVFVVADVLGGEASRAVGDLLGKSPRRYSSFICLTIAPGVRLDEQCAGPADVFAVVMDDLELGEFRKGLKAALPAGVAVAEAEPRPEQVTQLADIGDVKVFPGTPVGDVYVPDKQVARVAQHQPPLVGTSTQTSGAAFVLPDPSSFLGASEVAPGPSSGPTPEQNLSAPPHAPQNRGVVARNGHEGSPTGPDADRDRDRDGGAGPRPLHRNSSVVLVWVTHPSRGARAAP
jgi:hypothetical protein